MMRFVYAMSKSIRTATLFLASIFLAVIALSPAPARALPPASGSKCSSNWVNNEGAMSCFIQGEEDVRNGVKHPHYVACTAAGEVFCCVDDDRGNQDCEVAVKTGGGKEPIGNMQIRAILDSQRTILTVLDGLNKRIEGLETRLGDTNRKPSP